ncbi:MAG: UDP-N-acetylmuramoyl-L-alanine--D-glutamate ligase [Bacillota bacterium]|nr:UDP-N-acetylmuramoyl-L-alanine--D-glutamate ligase [Bacillota bacterium]
MSKNDSVKMKDKKVLIVGMGNSGRAAAQAMVKLGAQVAVQDSKKEEDIDPQLLTFLKEKSVTCYLGSKPRDIGSFDMLILSPGVSPQLDFVCEARDKGVEIIGELEIAYRVGSGNYVAITGTNGKTTTTTLVGEIYKAAGRETYVVGNIGVAVISKALSASDDSWLVTETSSFQLETIKEFRPEISAILNLTPDHMDRHKTMANYGRAKAEVFKNQGPDQYCIVNYDDKECFKLAEACNAKVIPFSRKEQLSMGAYVADGKILVKDEAGAVVEICRADELQIPGSHNLENALASCAIAFFGGIGPEIIGKVLKSFGGVEHRLELCNEIDGIKFVNDSKGTNPEAAIKAIEAMGKNIVLIAGGYDKDSSFEEFVGAFDRKVKALMLLGKTATKIKDAAESAGFTNSIILKDMEACVREAYRIAQPGDVVLLSPACASWDMYTSFEQRGKHFKSCVQALER